MFLDGYLSCFHFVSNCLKQYNSSRIKVLCWCLECCLVVEMTTKRPFTNPWRNIAAGIGGTQLQTKYSGICGWGHNRVRKFKPCQLKVYVMQFFCENWHCYCFIWVWGMVFINGNTHVCGVSFVETLRPAGRRIEHWNNADGVIFANFHATIITSAIFSQIKIAQQTIG